MPSRTTILRAILVGLLLAFLTEARAPEVFAQSIRRVNHRQACTTPLCRHCQGHSNGRSCVCNPNFWIVSSRRCKQGGLFRRSRPGCRLEQFQYVNGRAVRRNPADFQRWLVPGAPICIVIHGVFTRFDSLLNDSRAMCRWLHAASPGRPLNVVMFSWPSDRIPTGILSLDVTIQGRFAAFNAFYLSRFLKQVPDGSRVCLFGHSLGARTVASLLHLQGGGTVQGFRLHPCLYNAHRYRAIYVAPAIDHDWMNPGERYGRAICRVEALANVHNKCDLPLLFYPLRKPFGRKALGHTAFLRGDLRKIGRHARKIREVDASRIIGRHHQWLHYFNSPQIARSVHQYIDFSDEITIGYKPLKLPAKTTAGRIVPTSGQTILGIRRLSQ